MFSVSAATPCICAKRRRSSADTGSRSPTLPRLSEWGRVITYRQAQLEKLRRNVDVHVGVGKMSADDVLQYGADRVVIATGSHWCADGRGANYGPIAGADASLPHVLTPDAGHARQARRRASGC